MDAVAHAVRGDGEAAEGGGHGDRDSLEDRLHGEAERATVLRECVADDGEQRRAGHARPRHDEEEPREDERPRWRQPVESIADHRERHEEEEGVTSTVSIADPSAGILVDAIEEVLARPEEADGGDRCAENLEVFWHEALPEVLAEREEEHRRGHGNDVALEAERIADAPPYGPGGRHLVNASRPRPIRREEAGGRARRRPSRTS